jgi:hypothetical protein
MEKSQVGKISFRLALSRQVSSSCQAGRKRKTPTSVNETNAEAKTLQAAHDTNSVAIVGWIFTPLNSSQEYLLSVSMTLAKKTCDAARFQQTVRLDRYVQFFLKAQPASAEHPDPMNVVLLEVPDDALSIVDPGSPCNTFFDSAIDVWTLQQTRRLEVMNRQENVASSRTDAYTIRAKVHAVSPIIAMDTSNPFVLMELFDYHDDESILSCVAVIRHDALLCVEALYPGDDLVLHKVLRQQWRIPDMLEAKGYRWGQKIRVNSYVYVVDKECQIIWCQSNPDHVHMNRLPTTELRNIQGCIQSVHYTKTGSQIHIQFLTLTNIMDVASNPSTSKCLVLLLTYFPMSSALQLSLREGASVEVYNVHAIDNDQTYAACLRSKICLRRLAIDGPAPGAKIPPTMKKENCRGKGLPLPIPYSFLKIRRSYHEWVLRIRLENWLSQARWRVPIGCRMPFLDELISFWFPESFPQKRPARNPYAEFFDHAFLEYPCEKRTKPQPIYGCHLSTNTKPFSMPSFLDLAAIQTHAFNALSSKLDRLFEIGTDLQVGWHAAFVLEPWDLSSNSQPFSKGEHVYTSGFGHGKHHNNFTSLSLTTGGVILPVSGLCINADVRTLAAATDFFIGRLRSIVVSCLCVGFSSNDSRSDRHCRKVLLPPPESEQNKATGCCAILEIQGLLLIASFCLDCDEMRTINSSCSVFNANEEPIGTEHSVRDLLDPLSAKRQVPGSAVGLLVRKSMKLAKIRNCEFNGLMLTLSQAPLTSSIDEFSCIQSIEIKPPVRVNESWRIQIRRWIASGLGATVTEDQLSLILVWWTLASSASTCALLSGGWDEFQGISAPSIASTCGVLVRFPSASAQQDAKRGYVRLRCAVDDLSASFFFPISNAAPTDANLSEDAFHFSGGERFLTGMLNRRVTRTRSHLASSKDETRLLPILGDLLLPPTASEIPSCTLADLHLAICRDLRQPGSAHLAPSLVREIRNATFLSVSYCSAQAQCSKCFQTLVNPSANGDGQKEKKGDEGNGLVRTLSRNLDREGVIGPSYWDRPLPNEPMVCPAIPPTSPPISTPRPQGNSREGTHLRCPNNCNVNYHGSIKWECSGVLDDGTGQAKLYAEREAALSLLGMSAIAMQAVEAGAWVSDRGIVFVKTAPPAPHIRSAVVMARSLAREALRLRSGGRHHRVVLQESDVLPYLTPSTQAAYCLERHGRSSVLPLREVSYLVRCKPLSDHVSHLNHTEVDLAVPGPDGSRASRPTPSYALPPLKLTLVDTVCRSRVDERHRNDRVNESG